MVSYRKIVEKTLGRKLKSGEIVHHKNGDQHNEEYDNLEVILGQSEHMKRKHLTSKDYERKIKEIIESVDSAQLARTTNKAFDEFFTARQKEIIFLRIYELPMSKTEQEYYSRTIKPKLRALANPAVRVTAQEALLS